MRISQIDSRRTRLFVIFIFYFYLYLLSLSGGQDYLLLRHEGTSMGKLHGLFSPGADDDCDDDNDDNDKTSDDDKENIALIL